MSVEEKYNTIGKTQEDINQLKTTMSKEGFGTMEERFKVLNAAIQESKLKLMDRFEADIIAVLESEIIKRYFYREGMYAYFMATNTEVFNAQEILNDTQAYQNILK
jgi:carboxyl-terminal processing protease